MYGVQRKMKEVAEEAKPLLSLQDKNNMADKQEEALAKDIQHLATWVITNSYSPFIYSSCKIFCFINNKLQIPESDVFNSNYNS